MTALDSQEVSQKPQEPSDPCTISTNREMQAASTMDRTSEQIAMGQGLQHFSQDLLLQGLLAQTFTICDIHPRRSRHVIKGASLKTWVLPDGGQSLEQAQPGKQLCLLQPHPCWRPYPTSTQALHVRYESSRNSPSWTTRETEEMKDR